MEELPILDEYHLEWRFKAESFVEGESAQLHHFADTSEVGYGCVSYLGLVDVNQWIHCTFVFGKARVAPLKQLTIPRMELTVTGMAAKIDSQLQSEFSFPLDTSHFWTDCTSVLGYLKNEKA